MRGKIIVEEAKEHEEETLRYDKEEHKANLQQSPVSNNQKSYFD